MMDDVTNIFCRFAEDTLHIKDIAPLINKDVNMYRVTGDDWDEWGAVASHFGVAARAATASRIYLCTCTCTCVYCNQT